MKVTVAIDSFKGSLTSIEAGQAAALGVRNVYADADIRVRPLADGGEGTVEALVYGMGGELREVSVTGPLGEPVSCQYGVMRKNKTAVIEMASAAGIMLVPEHRKNPLKTTTYGVGELIRDAIQEGCRRFIVGIGGSATNDGGAGMLQALGYGLLDYEGRPISAGAGGLETLEKITCDQVIPELLECSFRIACDVTNPLCGEAGSSAVFGPQKGADAAMIKKMDAWLCHFAEISKRVFQDKDVDPNTPGAGAAGGLGFAFLSFTNAVLESGVRIVLEETNLEHYVKDADLVITGEGRLDAQTVMGKAPIGVAGLAKKYEKTVIAFSGCAAEGAEACNQAGIDAFFPILRSVTTLEEAMDRGTASRNLTAAAEQVFRLVRASQFPTIFRAEGSVIN